MMKRIKINWRLFVLTCALLLFASLLCGCGNQSNESVPNDAQSILSHGVQILSASTEMAVWGPRGNDVVFEAEDFSRNLNLSTIDYIKVVSLPSAAEGELLMGSVRVTAGQVISGENIAHLCFSAADETVTRASFCFSANGNATTLTCNIHLLDGSNYAPTVSMASSATLQMSPIVTARCTGVFRHTIPTEMRLFLKLSNFPKTVLFF